MTVNHATVEKYMYVKIARVLVLGGLGLSVLVGVVVAILEFERLDDYAVSLAIDEFQPINIIYHRHYRIQTTESLRQLEKSIQNTLAADKLILVEVYDEYKKKILERSRKEIESIKAELEQKQHIFPFSDKPEYMKIFYDNQIYVKILLPVLSEDKEKIVGYFEGIYDITEEQTSKIIMQVVLSMSQAIIIVLLTSSLMFPFILILNKNLIKRSTEILTLNKHLINRSKKILEANIDTLRTLGSTIAKRDSDTNAHNYRVSIYSIGLAEAIGLQDKEMQALIKGAFLHDVGKIGISDSILLKPDKLTTEEFSIMKKHVQLGLEIIESNEWLKDARDVVRFHHEKYDGSGYMQGLKGENIPINARIFAISDVFDALTSVRPYKKAFSVQKSIAILREGAGSHFDPILVQKFELIVATLHATIAPLSSEFELNGVLSSYIEKYFQI